MPGRRVGKAAARDKAENQVNQKEESEENDPKAPIEAKADGAETAESDQEASTKKSGRGRPKKVEGEEPVAKKSKTARVMSKPSRVSQRVSNQKKGVKMPDTKDEIPKKVPKKKSSKKTEKPVKDVSETDETDEEEVEATSNGAPAEQTVES